MSLLQIEIGILLLTAFVLGIASGYILAPGRKE